MIPFNPPVFQGKDEGLKTWISGMITTLQEIFRKLEPQLEPGTIVLWPDGVSIPSKYLLCDGTEYTRGVSSALYKVLGESSPGNFEVPTVTGPSGTVAVIRV